MLKHNPKSYSAKPDRGQSMDREINSNGDQTQDDVFEPFYYELDDLLKGVTPDKIQEEISTGPAVGKEVF